MFDAQTLNRPPAEYTKVAVLDGVVSLVLDGVEGGRVGFLQDNGERE